MTNNEGKRDSHELCPKPPSVFVRDATGLVRAWSVRDAFLWNFLTASIVGLAFYTFLPVEFPGGNMILSVVLMTFASIPFFLTYAMLAAAMPRSGGDYVYQSRILHPAIGFMTVQAGYGIFILGLPLSAGIAGYWLVEVGLAPMFIRLGQLWNNPALVSSGIWLTTTWGLFICEVAIVLLTMVTLLLPMRIYVRIQWVQMVFVLGTIVAMLVALVGLSNSAFVSSLNTAMERLGNGPNFYSSTIVNATAAGYNPMPHFSLYNTFGVWGVFWGSAAWYSYSVWAGGEIKQASSLKKQIYAMIGSLFAMNLGVTALIGSLFFRASGTAFFNSFAYATFTGTLTHFLPGVPPNIPSLTILILNSPVLIIIIALGYAFQSYQLCVNSTLPATRTTMAAAFDRLLPNALADVSPRFHTPVKTIILFTILGLLGAVLFNFTTYFTYFVSAFLLYIPFLLTMTAAIIFPFRKATKEIYEGSTIASYKLGNVPIVSILGSMGLIFMLVIIWFNIVTPALIPNELSWITILIGYVLLLALYFVMRWYRKSRGIDVSLAFKTIPPE